MSIAALSMQHLWSNHAHAQQLLLENLLLSTQFWRLYQWYRAAGGQGIWDQHGLALVWSDSTGRPQPPASGTHIHQPSDDQQRKVTLYHSQIVWRLWIISSHNYYIHECLWYYITHCPCIACQRKCCLRVICYLMKIALKCWQTSYVESSNQSSFLELIKGSRWPLNCNNQWIKN